MSRKFNFVQDNGETFPEWEEKTLDNILHEPKKEAVSDPSKTELVTVKLYGKGIERTGKCPNKTANARPYYIRNQGELLIGRQNFHNGGMGILPSDLDGLIASNAISSYSLREEAKEQSSMEFIHFLISRKEFYSKVDKLIGGTGQKELSRSEFNKLRIPLPSLPEQQKIAEFFSALDERIALTANKVQLLKEQKTGYLQQVFNRELVFTDDNGDTYKNWEQKKVSDVASLKNGYAFESKSYREDGKYIVTTIANVTGKRYVTPESSHKVRVVPEDIREHQILQKGDILVALSGSITNLGRISIVNTDNLLLNQRVGLLQLSSVNVDPDYFYQVLSSNTFINSMVEAGQGAAQKNLKKDDIENFSFPLPSLPEQDKIAEFFTALDKQIELTENKLSLLKEQKKGYLQGIFG